MLRSCIAGQPSKGYLHAVYTFLGDTAKLSNGTAIRKLYTLLLNTHRNEYVYKNTLLNRIVMGRHSPRTSTAFTEVPIGDSIADFLIVNDRATVYEIKTDLDNLGRLDSQLTDYYRSFDHACVVCGERYLPIIMKTYADTPVGIVVMTNRQHLSIRKEPQAYSEALRHESLFKQLRKEEYATVLARCGIEALPSSSSFYYYRNCLSVFEQVPIADAYSSVLTALRKRGKDVDVGALKAVPPELRSLGYFIRINRLQSQRLATFLRAPIAPMEGAI
jgi:hypothetical protein